MFLCFSWYIFLRTPIDQILQGKPLLTVVFKCCFYPGGINVNCQIPITVSLNYFSSFQRDEYSSWKGGGNLLMVLSRNRRQKYTKQQ